MAPLSPLLLSLFLYLGFVHNLWGERERERETMNANYNIVHLGI
jgi:hypothetical protein